MVSTAFQLVFGNSNLFMIRGNMRRALVLGAGDFIGSYIVKSLKSEGYWARRIDLNVPDFQSHRRTSSDF